MIINESYFNNKKTTDINVNDININMYSNNNIFSVVYSLYIIGSKLEKVLESVNFKHYFNIINNKFQNLPMLLGTSDMYIKIKFIDQEQNIALSDTHDKFLNTLYNMLSFSPTHKGEVVIYLSVNYSNLLQPNFKHFVKYLKEFTADVYPLFEILKSASDSQFGDNHIYYSNVDNGEEYTFSGGITTDVRYWKYKNYASFYYILYGADNKTYDNKNLVGTEIVYGKYNIKPVIKLCYKLLFSEINEKKYAYKLYAFLYNNSDDDVLLYILLMPLNDDDTSQSMVDWMKENIIEHLSPDELLRTVGSHSNTTVMFHIGCIIAENNDKITGKQKYEYQQKLNDWLTITWKFKFEDGGFNPYNSTKQFSDNAQNAVMYRVYFYEKFLADGVFGHSKRDLPDNYFKNIKEKYNK